MFDTLLSTVVQYILGGVNYQAINRFALDSLLGEKLSLTVYCTVAIGLFAFD
jgi:hypothetical protein